MIDLNRVRQSIPPVLTGLLNGNPVDDDGGERIAVINPDNGSAVLELIESNMEQVNQAVVAARVSFDGGSWSKASISYRQKVLFKAAEMIRKDAEVIAAQDSLCTGLLYHKSTLSQTRFASADWFEFFASSIGVFGEELFRHVAGAKTLVSREPVGVAALFTPWNIPVMGASLKLAAALAMGNSCVLKPSEQSPLGTYRLVQLLHHAGLPEGVIQLVNGRGAVTGASLASHPDVDLISFTGGEEAGRIIAGEAAKRFAKVTMELGGKSANIIFNDANYERALDGALVSIFANNGQACLAGSRILLQKKIADRFIADFTDRAKNIRIGRPFDEDAELGPLSSVANMQRVLSYADIVRDDGGEILAGGNRVYGFEDGCYVEPTVALAKDNRARVCQEELFGPFVTFLTFETEEEAIALGNDTRFGLAGYVWTQNLQRAMLVADSLRSGYVLINSVMQREKNAPFGGFGHSGIDREGGKSSLRFYSESKATLIACADTDIPKMGLASQNDR